MTLFIRLIIVLTMSLPIHADSFPFNETRTHVGIEYTVLKLTSVQQLELERAQRVTLNAVQKKLLGGFCKYTPPVLDIIPSNYNDCTCNMSAIGVWFINGEIEVPLSFLPNEESEFIENGPLDKFKHGITIDTRGQFWYRSTKLSIRTAVDRLRQIHEQLLTTIRNASEPPWALVWAPPERTVRNRKAFMTRLNALKNALTQAGIALSAPPYINDVQ